MTPPVPIEIRRTDRAIVLRWAEDHTTAFEARSLRLACPCAGCREEMTGAPLLDPATVPDDVRPDALELVGAYGFRIRWSDGHDTGIFTYEALYRPPGPASPAGPAGDEQG